MVTSSIRAGKAALESTLSMAWAALGKNWLIPRPITTGSSISRRFCLRRFPTGRVMPTSAPEAAVTQPITMGRVMSVRRLLIAVRVTERATSPPASLEKMLDELPPGEQAMSIRPMKNTGVRLKAQPSPRAMRGSRMICPQRATKKALGRVTTI